MAVCLIVCVIKTRFLLYSFIHAFSSTIWRNICHLAVLHDCFRNFHYLLCKSLPIRYDPYVLYPHPKEQTGWHSMLWNLIWQTSDLWLWVAFLRNTKRQFKHYFSLKKMNILILNTFPHMDGIPWLCNSKMKLHNLSQPVNRDICQKLLKDREVR